MSQSMEPCWRPHVRIATQKIMVTVGQGHHRGMVRPRLIDLIDGHVKLEEQLAVAVVPDHALYPEDRRQPRAAMIISPSSRASDIQPSYPSAQR
jgi:hypothetical protein